MMKDSFFSSRVYFGTYEPIFRFKEFGDTENYWIALKYYVNRDDYQSVAGRRGDALNLDLLNGDGEAVFGDIPAAHLAELRSRGYVLGAQHPEPANDEGDLFLVRENYVYAPNKTFVVHSHKKVPIFGIRDYDGQTSGNIAIGRGAGNVYRTDITDNSIIHLASNGANFFPNDIVSVVLNCTYGVRSGGFGSVNWYKASARMNDVTIAAKRGDYIELASELYGWRIDSIRKDDNCRVYSEEEFFNCLNGNRLDPDHDLYLRPLNGYVIKAFAERTAGERTRPIREKIAFSLEPPACPAAFIPKYHSGEELKNMTRSTIPTAAQWKARVARGDWYQYEEAEPTYDDEFGVYELRVRETQCF